MKTKIFFLSIVFLMNVAGVSAEVLKGTVLLNGEEITAEYTKLTNNTVALGTGYNACIPQYSAGRVCVPEEVTISGKTYRVTEVNSMAFRLCDQITFVELRGNVTRIGEFAFVGCSSLKEVILPSTLKSIGSGAFIDLPIYSIICGAETPPVWEYNNVFRFMEDGIGDSNVQAIGSGVRISVPKNSVDDYQNAMYSDPSLGWTTPNGWGIFTAYNDEYLKNYRIYTPDDLESLKYLTDNPRDDQVIHRITLEADIDMTGREVWTHGLNNYIPSMFNGVFEGHNHTIKGLQVINNSADPVGLFASFDGDTIRNLRLKDCVFEGLRDVGAIAGGCTHFYPAVENIYVDAYVRGCLGVGGLIGDAEFRTVSMKNCVFAGSVALKANAPYPEQSSVGGLIGEPTYGTIKNCAVIGNVVPSEEGEGGPFVGRPRYNIDTPIRIDSSYCASSGFSDYNPSPYADYVRLGKAVIIANRDGYDFYQAGNVYPHKFGELYNIGEMTNMQTFLMVPDLGLDSWVYKFGEYPLPACMEDLWPVEKNVFTLRPANMPTDRVNGLVYNDKIKKQAFRTFEGLDADVPSFHCGDFTASRLWFDENINPDIMDRPGILPLGFAQITATDGVEYNRELKATDIGPNIVYEPEIQLDSEGNPELDDEGNFIETGNTIEIQNGRSFEPVGFSIYLPYNVTLSPFCKLYQPVGTTVEDETTIIKFQQMADNEVQPFQPYYVVVEEDTITLSTEEEVFCPRTSVGETEIDGWRFVGTVKKISGFEAFHQNAYILQADGKWHRVIDENSNIYIPAFRAYFRKKGSAARVLSMAFIEEDDETTGVVQIQTTDLDGTERYYDLNGRPVVGKPTQRGIYITNGKKMMIQ